MEVWWVRHGETAANAAGVWQGQRDVPLSEAGRRQIAALAERLKALGVRFDGLYSSDLGRALASAEILGKALDLPVRPDPRLRELCLGALAGVAKEDALERFAAYFEASQKDPWHARPPGGESLADLRARVEAFLKDLNPNGRYLAVAHAGTIRVAAWIALHLDCGEPWRYIVPNASVHVGDYAEGRLVPGLLGRSAG